MTAESVEDIRVSPTPDETYDASLAAAVPAVAAGLAMVEVVLAVLHAVALEGLPRLVMVPVAVASAVLFAGTFLLLRRRRLAPHLAHPVTAGMLMMVVGSSVAAMVLVGQPRYTSNLMLVLVGAGVTVLSLRWMLAVVYLTWGAWIVAALAIGPSEEWPHYAVALALSTGLAVVVNQLRRSGVRELADSLGAADAAAVRDHLTGLANRRGLAMVGPQVLEHARRQGDAVHCVFVDIDGLKQVNDALGHSVGDEVIVAVADALRDATRATDIVARWGGDQFCVVGPGPGMATLELERRVRDGVMAHSPVPADIWPGRVSAGGAMLAPWDAGTLETLLGKADQEMYLRRSLRKEDPRPTPRRAPSE